MGKLKVYKIVNDKCWRVKVTCLLWCTPTDLYAAASVPTTHGSPHGDPLEAVQKNRSTRANNNPSQQQCVKEAFKKSLLRFHVLFRHVMGLDARVYVLMGDRRNLTVRDVLPSPTEQQDIKVDSSCEDLKGKLTCKICLELGLKVAFQGGHMFCHICATAMQQTRGLKRANRRARRREDTNNEDELKKDYELRDDLFERNPQFIFLGPCAIMSDNTIDLHNVEDLEKIKGVDPDYKGPALATCKYNRLHLVALVTWTSTSPSAHVV
ncbi:hypothetical protein Bbelb_050730 [Branchiostoma belcheri]|nr:hypothetical protein Bbelb_050730 [Branchiostoma belcheri]